MPADTARSPCPVACTLDLIGDRWTLLVIRDLFAGKGSFTEFARSPERIATNILSDRLALLTERGLVEKSVPAGAKRARYQLTETGLSLLPVLKAVAAWGIEHIPGTQAHLMPID